MDSINDEGSDSARQGLEPSLRPSPAVMGFARKFEIRRLENSKQIRNSKSGTIHDTIEPRKALHSCFQDLEFVSNFPTFEFPGKAAVMRERRARVSMRSLSRISGISEGEG
jgi:hypothetical protein